MSRVSSDEQAKGYSLDVQEENLRRLYKEMLKEAMGGNKIEKQNITTAHNKQITILDERLDKLQDLLVDGKISSDEYNKIKGKYEKERVKLNIEVADLSYTDKESDSLLEKAVRHVSRLSQLYGSYDLDGKVRLLGSIFPEKLIYVNGKCRTPRINEVVRLALLIDKGFGKRKTGQLSEKLELSRVVEYRGVEPLTFRLPV